METVSTKEILKELLQSKVTTVSSSDSNIQKFSKHFDYNSSESSQQHYFTISLVVRNQKEPVMHNAGKQTKFTIIAQSQMPKNYNQNDEKVISLQVQIGKLRDQIKQAKNRQEKLKYQYQLKIQELENLNHENLYHFQCDNSKIKQICQNCSNFMKNQNKNGRLDSQSAPKVANYAHVTRLQSQQLFKTPIKSRKGSINSLQKIRKIVEGKNKMIHQQKAQDCVLELSFCSQHSIIDGLNAFDQ